MRFLILCPLIAAGLLCAAEKPDQPLIKAELDSIECHFDKTDTATTPCTVRIHLLPVKGVSIAPQKDGDEPLAPLQCIDGEGNLILGTFRGWEDCYDGNDDCHTIAYDFFTTPRGGCLTADAHIPVPITKLKDKQAIVTFSPTEKKRLTVAGHELSIEPRADSKEAKHASQTAFDIVYDHPGVFRQLHLCTPTGEPVKGRAIFLDKKKAGVHLDGSTRVTYILHSDTRILSLGIAPAPITTTEQVHLRFRVTIGTLDEKH